MHSTFLFFMRKFSTFPDLTLIYLLEKTSSSPPPGTAIIRNTLLLMRQVFNESINQLVSERHDIHGVNLAWN